MLWFVIDAAIVKRVMRVCRAFRNSALASVIEVAAGSKSLAA
jgi:hypothetical protein